MPTRARKTDNSSCQWIGRTEAFRRFATHSGGTESSRHIKPLHWYIACRLVLEGGFRPDYITPRPPFAVAETRTRNLKGARYLLSYDQSKAGSGEQIVLGGLKTKNVDVVVTNPIVGPVLAVSCKGTTKSFRNLANRLEETIGECTNLHITYSAMVLGYFALLRANRTLQDALDAPADNSDNAGDDGLVSSADTGSGPRDIGPSGIKTEIVEANDVAITFGADGVETAAEGITHRSVI